jgi:hypothetical protein
VEVTETQVAMTCSQAHYVVFHREKIAKNETPPNHFSAIRPPFDRKNPYREYEFSVHKGNCSSFVAST